LKISAVFSDYDGTLAAQDVPIESSNIPAEIESPLERLGSMVPIAIVTSKDSSFIRPRTPFASAWACVSGLEIILRGGKVVSNSKVSRRLREGLAYARALKNQGVTIELKRSADGKRLLGFSVDWRRSSKPSSRFIKTATGKLTEMGLCVLHEPDWPFLDVFGARPDKGLALKELKRLLGVKGNAIFLGDSTADNSAFEESDVGICVEHGQGLENLGCGFVVRHRELDGLFRSLADNDLELDLSALEKK